MPKSSRCAANFADAAEPITGLSPYLFELRNHTISRKAPDVDVNTAGAHVDNSVPLISHMQNHGDTNLPFNLLLINARSIINKMHYLRDLALLNCPDVIMLTETWCSDEIPDSQLSLVGYSLFRSDRILSRGGGCIMYCKLSLLATNLTDSRLTAIRDSLWLLIRTNAGMALFGCIYRAPTSDRIQMECLIQAFRHASQLPFPYKVIGGDFNMPEICWSLPSSTGRFSEFTSTVLQYGWTQHVTIPTRFNRPLDLIFTSGVHTAYVRTLNPLTGSDHKIVDCTLKLSQPTVHHPTLFRNFRHLNLNNLTPFLRSLDWTDFFLTTEPEIAADILYNHLNSYIEFSLPAEMKPSHPRSSLDDIPPNILRKLRKVKSRYYKTADFSCLLLINKINLELHHKKMLKTRRDETRALMSKDSTCMLSRLLRHRAAEVQRPNYIVLPDGSIADTDEAICEAFSNYFSESLVNDQDIYCTSQAPNPSFILSSISVSLEKVSRLVASTKPSLKPGPDGLPPAMLLHGNDIPILLLNIYNLSLNESHFPSKWKQSVIFPRYKGGSKADLNNYRPINHTPAVAKVLERIVNESLIEFMISHSLIHPSQYGFIKNRSCTTCQFDFLNYVTESIDKGLALIILFLDMRKAFDRVPHKRLLNKLSAVGIRNPLLTWFKSYLDGRTQVVKLGTCTSNARPVTSGVIQGSVLGPTLFLIYIDDIFTAVSHGKAYVFADDIKIVYAFEPSSQTDVFPKLTDDLATLESWSSRCGMWFSAEKCSLISFRCALPDDRFVLHNSPIPIQNNVRDLGLRYSVTFNFAEQVAYQVTKAQQTIGYICKHFITNEARLRLYLMIARPILEYCPVIYSNLRKCDRVALEKVQRAFTKRILGYSCKLNYRTRCETLCLDPLWLRRLRLGVNLLYSIIHRTVHCNSATLSFHSNSTYILRNKSKIIQLPLIRTVIRSKFFIIRYASIWNKLPTELRDCDNPNRFKKLLKQFFTVSCSVSLLNPCMSLDIAYEEGVTNC
jgi:hypothetical protein